MQFMDVVATCIYVRAKLWEATCLLSRRRSQTRLQVALASACNSALAIGAVISYIYSLFCTRRASRPAPTVCDAPTARSACDKGYPLFLQSILITGAASGIGQALALRYAGPGISLALTDRDEAGLQRTAFSCTQRGANVSVGVVDVTDVASMTAWVTRMDADAPVDLACEEDRACSSTSPRLAGTSLSLSPPSSSCCAADACAGIGDHQDRDVGRRPAVERVGRVTRAVFSVNVGGVHNALRPLVEPMCGRGHGQVGEGGGRRQCSCWLWGRRV